MVFLLASKFDSTSLARPATQGKSAFDCFRILNRSEDAKNRVFGSDKARGMCYTVPAIEYVFPARGMRSMESGESPGESVTVKPAKG